MKHLLPLLLLPVLAIAQNDGIGWAGTRVKGQQIFLVGSNSSTAGATSYQTGPYQPRENSLLLAHVVSSKASAPDIPTGTGNALTWVQLRTTNYFSLASPTVRNTVFMAHSRSGATTNGFTATFGGTATGCIITVVEITNCDTTGSPDATNALVQIVHGGGNVNTNATCTFAAASGTRNLAIGFVGGSLNSQNNTAESGWTKLAGANYNTPATEASVIYQYNTTDTSFLSTNAAAMSWTVIGVEIKQR